MKKIILIAIAYFIIGGCTSEITEGCPVTMELIFAYNEDVQAFNDKIGSDVLLHIYNQDRLHGSSTIISYEDIQSGAPYVINKTFSGKTNIIAWAVPATGDAALLEGCSIDQNYPSAYFSLPLINHNSLIYSPGTSELYLGKISVVENTEENCHHTISLYNVFCSLSVDIVNKEYFSSQYTGTVEIQIAGTSSGFLINNYQPHGDTAIVRSPFIEKDDHLTTNVLGILPSVRDWNDKIQTICLSVLVNEQCIFSFDTAETSDAGKKISVIIRPENNEADISVEGVRKTIPLEY